MGSSLHCSGFPFTFEARQAQALGCILPSGCFGIEATVVGTRCPACCCTKVVSFVSTVGAAAAAAANIAAAAVVPGNSFGAVVQASWERMLVR